jgi:hypothetical protein
MKKGKQEEIEIQIKIMDKKDNVNEIIKAIEERAKEISCSKKMDKKASANYL